MTDVILVAGNVGAGKSTYAARLARQRRAHVFAVDAWMRTLFFADMPDPPSHDWALARTQRIDAQILDETRGLAHLGVPVILDLGFFGRAHRAGVRETLGGWGLSSVVHSLDVPKNERWRSVSARNAERGETFRFEVRRDTFGFCETIFYPLDEDELHAAVIIAADRVRDVLAEADTASSADDQDDLHDRADRIGGSSGPCVRLLRHTGRRTSAGTRPPCPLKVGARLPRKHPRRS